MVSPWSRSRVSLSIYLYPTVHPVFPPDPSLRGAAALRLAAGQVAVAGWQWP